MKKILTTMSILLTAFAFTNAQSVTDPMITSWLFNTSGQTYSGTKVDVEAVYYTTTRVYVKSSGIPNYYSTSNLTTDGTAYAWNASNKTNVFVLPRTQTVPTSDANRTYMRDEGNVAVFKNGMVAFTPCDGKSYNSAGVWHQLAYKFEYGDFDSYGGHANPSGTYHNHVKPSALISSSTTTHSGIIGYAFDGYPIYGPYAYTNTDGTGAITRMKTSWKTNGATARTSGPTIASQALGKYWEDYEYSAGYGTLDRYNGRTCVTPEYPSGTYCYFITVDASGNPEFPYIVGDYLYGTPLKNNGGKLLNASNFLTSNTVDASATLYSSTAPVELTKFEAKQNDCTVRLAWQTAMEVVFNRFEVEWSEDGKQFEKIGTFKAKGNNSTYSFSHSPLDGVSYYRLKMIDEDETIKYSPIASVPIDCGMKNVKIQTYPNPFFSSLTVETGATTPRRINVYNMNKQLVYTTETQGTTKIDMANQPSGAYVMEVFDEKTKMGMMQKVIKQ